MAVSANRPYVLRAQPHPCAHCGTLTQRPKFCSPVCSQRSRPPRRRPVRNPCGPVRQCAVCGADFRRPNREVRDSGECCSRECGFELLRQRGALSRLITSEKMLYARWSRRAKAPPKPAPAPKPKNLCGDCGAEVPRYARRCEPCRGKAAEIAKQRARFSESRKAGRRRYRARRRAIECGAAAERFDPFVIFERDRWRCHLCGCRTPRSLRGTYQDRAPELDHIVPLSKGGQHTRANVACSCRKCNHAKGDKPLGQLLLVA